MTEIAVAEKLNTQLEAQSTAVTVANLGTIGRRSIEVVKAVAQTYARAQAIAESIPRIFKIPMLVIGWDMPQTAEHITRSLLSSGYTKDNPSGSLFGSQALSPVLSHVAGGRRGWYTEFPIYENRPPGTSIDEYPYAATAQGGEANYNRNLVSLKVVPVYEQNRQGGIMSNFYRRGMVGDGGVNDPTSWYLNFAYFGSLSYMIDRDGNKHFFRI